MGTIWFSWVTDQIGAAARGRRQIVFDWTGYTGTDYDDLRLLLVPRYTFELPRYDAWGSDYELGQRDLRDTLPMAIRPVGADHMAEGTEYPPGAFLVISYTNDIVWAGGFFVRWPSGLASIPSP